LAVKATSALAKDSASKLSYKIDTGNYIELDAPLLILGTWVNSIVSGPDLKISFKLDPKPSNDSKDAVKVEIITGWPEAT
jgi:hypothetical protein